MAYSYFFFSKQLLSTGDKLYKLLHKNETSVQKAQIKSEKLIQQKDISIEEYNKARESQQANVVTKVRSKKTKKKWIYSSNQINFK